VIGTAVEGMSSAELTPSTALLRITVMNKNTKRAR
jgi:hypothetical protein